MHRCIGGYLAVLFLVGLSGCVSKPAVTTPAQVTINLSLPANTTLLPGQTAQFSASVSNATNMNVIWEVNAVVGGNSQVGTISASGLYTAPSTSAISGTTVTITAAAAANTSASATATVTLLGSSIVTLSPSNPSVYVSATLQFIATVTNSTNTAVMWQVNGVTGGSSTTGTISASGLYTAPGSLPNPNPVTVKAISAANSASTASTTVTILLPAPVVTVTPTSVSVPGNTTQQFSATVANTTNTAVTWEVNNIPGGNPTVGTISPTGLYIAPSAIPNPATVTVSAVSAANSTSVGSASVTVTTPEVVVVTPPSVTLNPYATQQFTGTSSIPSDTLTWQVNGVTGGGSTYGTITSAGLYTAPSSAPSNPIVVVKAISGSNPAIFGSAVISIGTAPPTVTVSPQGMGVVINTPLQFTASVQPSNLSQGVQWEVDSILGGNAIVGTISASGVYTAPLLVPTPAAVTISAVSTAVPNLFGTATITVTLPSTPISVTVSPLNAALMVGQSKQFSAVVAPTNNTAVTWTVSGSGTPFVCAASPSNACGSIDSTGNYTTPTSVPGGGQSANVTVTATSVADPTKFDTATVTITPVPTPTLTISATSMTVCSSLSNPTCGGAITGSAIFNENAQNFPTNAQLQFNWSIGCISADDGDSDNCPNDGDPADTNLGEPEHDGPGMIMASGGGTAGYTVSNSQSVVYLPPGLVFAPLPTLPAGYPCSNGSSNGVNEQWGFVPLTVSTQFNGNTYTSPPVCIEVIYRFAQ